MNGSASSVVRHVPRPVASLCRGIRDVMLPRGCAGCDMPDETLCPSCRGLFSQCVVRPMPASLFALRGICACATYRGPVRRAILQWKDHGDEEITRDLCAALRACVRNSGVGRALGSCDRVLVVPVPSSPASMRRRGRRHTLPLATAVSEQLVADGVNAEVESALNIRGVRSKSVQQIGAAQRSGRLADHLEVRSRYAYAADSGTDAVGTTVSGTTAVILVDDIVTTGSTLRQCAKVLKAVGLPVATAFSLAQVPD
ncbi:ComF family protein [Bifidobacterium simiarum]|uniref:Phosphoribosyl transferase n=1 Tax=Bifidobacterium simiarum TaxID=2045441 RepID=A0A2M9HDY1_9BIFI|nr:ComF family protein [Bifidobacterium simiarum]PJM75007.1 phosphoribosyl transferase [Bifidobacterium simiarum]